MAVVSPTIHAACSNANEVASVRLQVLQGECTGGLCSIVDELYISWIVGFLHDNI